MTGVTAQDNPLFPFAVLAMVAGPSVSGLLLTALTGGSAVRIFLAGRDRHAASAGGS